MSSAPTPANSPATGPIQPLHNPSQAAHVAFPKAPLGSVVNKMPRMGAKALLDRNVAKQNSFCSPTDNLVTPCSQKLNAIKKSHFNKGAKPMRPLFAQKEESSNLGKDGSEQSHSSTSTIEHDDENPF